MSQLIIGKTPERGNAEYWYNGMYHWVSISDMTEYGHVKNTKEMISENAASTSFGERISLAGSLIMSFKLTVGRTSILDIDAFHNEAIITILPYVDEKEWFRNFLFWTLPIVSNWGKSKDAIKGKTLNSKSLYNLQIPVPPLPEQQRIVSQIERLFEKLR